MNEIAKHKAAIEDADTQNKVFKSRASVYLKYSYHLRTLHTKQILQIYKYTVGFKITDLVS